VEKKWITAGNKSIGFATLLGSFTIELGASFLEKSVQGHDSLCLSLNVTRKPT
jgi:hypothetical protein